jgi:hypothetical protein
MVYAALLSWLGGGLGLKIMLLDSCNCPSLHVALVYASQKSYNARTTNKDAFSTVPTRLVGMVPRVIQCHSVRCVA